MTLTRRMALFIAGVLLLALGGALVIQTLAARGALQQQQDMRNRDTAAALALALSQQRGDPVALQAVAAAQFDLGHYRRITLTTPAGAQLIDLAATPPAAQAPAWFRSLLPVHAAPGSALVSSGWQELGTVTVEAHTAWAQEVLWRACARTAALLAALAAGAAVLAAALLRAWQRPLQATVAQAQALEQGRFVEAPLPALPELRHLTRSMNTTVRRLHDMFASQAGQVAYLQRQAQLDPQTGLTPRRHFLPTLAQALTVPTRGGQAGAPAAAPRPALLLVRLPQLERINQQQGRDTADALLHAMAEVLAALQRREPDSVAARLGGGDFAVLLPLPGMAAELLPGLQAELMQALSGHQAPRPVLATLDPLPAANAAATDAGDDATTAAGTAHASNAGTNPAAQALVHARAQALAHAEATLATGQALLDAAQAADALQGDLPLLPSATATPPQAASSDTPLARWQAQITQALADHRARLGEYAVLDRQGQLVHLECPLRLQLDPAGGYLPASMWLAAARRAGQLPEVDLAAIRLALYASALDRRPRAVNVALSSLAGEGFVSAVASVLGNAGDAAPLLSLEWVADVPGTGLAAARQAMAAWQGTGVRMGAEHAGGAPEQLAQLRDMGLAYVKVDAHHLRGAAKDTAVQAYARSLVGLVQLLGMQALAEGVDDAADLAMLWQLGFDGATGRAVANAPEARAATPQPVAAKPQGQTAHIH